MACSASPGAIFGIYEPVWWRPLLCLKNFTMEDHEILHTCSYPVLDGTFKVLDGYTTVMPPSGNTSFLNLPLYRLTSCGVTQTIILYYQWFSIFLFFGIRGRGRIMAPAGLLLTKFLTSSHFQETLCNHSVITQYLWVQPILYSRGSTVIVYRVRTSMPCRRLQALPVRGLKLRPWQT